MAIEGMSRLMEINGIVPKGIRIRNFGIKAAVFIPEDRDGVEIMLSMRQLPLHTFANSKDWWEFHIWSYSKQWTEHSSGIIGPECNDGTSIQTRRCKSRMHTFTCFRSKSWSFSRSDPLSELSITHGYCSAELDLLCICYSHLHAFLSFEWAQI